MLGLIFIYFIGRAFFRLAEEHNRLKWLWAVLGVVSYYVFSFIAGLLMAVIDLSWTIQNEGLSILIGVGLGIGLTIALYHLLRHNWKKNVVVETDVDILDQ